MTVIIGLVDEVKGNVYLGADSGSYFGYTRASTDAQKIVLCGDVLIGTAGALSAIQKVRRHMPHSYWEKEVFDSTPDMFMEHCVIAPLREIFDEDLTSDGVANIDLIVAFGEYLYTVNGDLAYECCNARGYVAIGAGEQYAMGSLAHYEDYVSEDCPFDPEETVMRALEAAELFCTVVDGPFLVCDTQGVIVERELEAMMEGDEELEE